MIAMRSAPSASLVEPLFPSGTALPTSTVLTL
jgi:hypothetical protein